MKLIDKTANLGREVIEIRYKRPDCWFHAEFQHAILVPIGNRLAVILDTGKDFYLSNSEDLTNYGDVLKVGRKTLIRLLERAVAGESFTAPAVSGFGESIAFKKGYRNVHITMPCGAAAVLTQLEATKLLDQLKNASPKITTGKVVKGRPSLAVAA